MIRQGLKKYAQELGFKVGGGVAYGVYKQYLLTLKEGSNWKAVAFSVDLTDEAVKSELQDALSITSFDKRLGVRSVSINHAVFEVVFKDTFKTISKMSDAIEIIIEKMAAIGVKSMESCSYCWESLFEGDNKAVLICGKVFSMHSACVRKYEDEVRENAEAAKNEGNVLKGIIGATIGAIVGAIPWAVAFYFGWFVGWLGFLIGIAAQKGYELFKGRETKVKGVVILIVSLLIVVFAEYSTYLFSWWYEFSTDPELVVYNLSFTEIFHFLNSSIAEDAEIKRTVIGDILMGWLFAGLGVLSTIRQIFTKTTLAGIAPVVLGDNVTRETV
ncbi:MAG: hypothetical protein EOM05_03880 [Clostridia bacterium]|nr:hypothetical protein [Clostridia bacterium]